ncbi:MAG: hypothetical protein BWY57_02451 [Betaproteobacteria bacterium ADurb.Bin341]|nr:MAG: hypothetical protein BWY57_02451 [Betaproteobacteria bacterium ADurb.Bin341]
MTVSEFISKWRKVELKERSAAQEHFLDLCNVFDHPTPAAADPTGETFCFEKGAAKHGGGDGFADVWKRGFFGWEYKGKHKDLSAAYDQLLRYRSALENPPLLLTCDLDRIVIHTNFTGTVEATYDIPLEALSEPRNIEIVRAVFHAPETLRPGRTSAAVTQEAAARIGEIAASMRERGLDPDAVAHFLDRIVFCLFAEDANLLPDRVFTQIVAQVKGDHARFCKLLGQLFDTMAAGGDFGPVPIRHFNGSLFDDRAVPDLTADDLKRIAAAAALDWSAVDPSIFGTLFERGLDPAKRSQLGAHFTGREDIELVVDAVVMAPLRREWEETKATVESLLATGKKSSGSAGVPPASSGKSLTPAQLRKARSEADSILHQFLTRLREVKVLDPACGSGNFLYVALLRLKDLEREAAVTFPGEHGLSAYLPGVGPWQLYGIEINPYAHDLAQMTVWIGWLQWIRANGFGFPADPILRTLSGNIRLMDSILATDGTEPDWPTVDFIIGNPPFLGGSKLWSELGREYQERLMQRYKGRVPGFADLCCYWFEKARAHIEAGKCKRAGLLATQGIRGGANREVLKRIKVTGDIFWAESDRPWVLDGANVHVSMVGFDDGAEKSRTLDGKAVITINANLTAAADTTATLALPSMANLSFIGTKKAGDFNITEDHARELLALPNPHGKPNSDILKPWLNGTAIVQRPAPQWIIDCGDDMTLEDFRLYDSPYQHVLTHVKPERDRNNEKRTRENWWLYKRNAPDVRAALSRLPRYISTPRIAKHRIFRWHEPIVLPDDGVFIFARPDDYFFGVLHSRFHEVWALKLGTRLETRPRYTPTTCFETFPFPESHADRDAAIAAAAKELNERRETWLNPPEWTRTETLVFPGTVGGPWDRYIDPATAEDRGGFKVGTVRYPRLVPRDADCAARLKDRTLTKLYNARPAWLADCHARLDAAVAAAYGWPADLTDDAILERLLALNLERGGS